MFFFFSSRRRHTRWNCDWSSDVCSSDLEQNALVTCDGGHAYRLSAAGLPLFAENACSSDAETQRAHYDRIAANYIAHLQYPHTIEYAAYLDRALLQVVGAGNLGTIA